MTRMAYYPGCSLEGTAKEFDASTRVACQELGVDLAELEGWSCCGASSAHATNYWLSLALVARNLRLAEEQGFGEIVAPCAMCFARFRHAVHDMRDPEVRAQVNALLDKPVQGDLQVHSIVDILGREEQLAQLKDKTERPLKELRLVAYYGCLLVRPPAILTPDDPENPMMLDRIIEAAGATVVDWPMKTECCGGSLALSRTDIALELTRKLLQDAIGRGANGIVTACPMCHANLDTRQGEINRHYGTDLHLPILYVTQLVGLATGHGVKELMLDHHLTNTLPLMKEAGVV